MRRLIIPILATTIAACGGGGGESSKSRKETRSSGSIEGWVSDSIVSHADVDIYRFEESGKKELLAETAKTNAEGKYVSEINAPSTYVMIEAGKGTGVYTEEESGETVHLRSHHVLKAIAHYQSGNYFTIIPNFWTTVAAGYTECRIREGLDIANAQAESMDLMGALVGVPVLTTYPKNPTWDDSAGFMMVDDGVKLGAMAAGVSKWTYDQAVAQGVEPHSPGFTSIDLMATMYNDIASDCRLDGKGLTPDGRTEKALGFGTKALNANVYRTEIPRAMLEFMASEKNLMDVKNDDLVFYATQLATSTANVFGDLKVEPFDEEGPVVTILSDKYQDGSYVHGQITIPFASRDLSGVESLRVLHKGGETLVYNGVGSSNKEMRITIDTSNQEEGPYEVTFLASDKLKNVTEHTIVLNVQNTKPIVRRTSKEYFNDTKYLYVAQVENVPQGLKHVVVHGEKASLKEGIITAEISLTQGYNNIEVTLTDALGRDFHHVDHAYIDLNPPLINVAVPSEDAKNRHSVYYLPYGTKTPKLKPFRQNADEPIYVARDRRSCNGLRIEEEELIKHNWPYILIKPSDRGDGTASTSGARKVTFDYSLGGSKRIDNQPIITTGGWHIIPFCEEYLGQDWYVVDKDLNDKAEFVIRVEDQSGNLTTEVLKFIIAERVMDFQPALSDKTYFGGEGGKQIKFDMAGLEGIDEVKLYIDGQFVKSIERLDLGYFVINPPSFKDGLHEAYFVFLDNGQELFTSEGFKFRIDNTPPKPVLVSPAITGEGAYILEIRLDDANGVGGSSKNLWVTTKGTTYADVSVTAENNYQIPLKLIPGLNYLYVTSEDQLGNRGERTLIEIGFDDRAPTIGNQYPDNYTNTLAVRPNESPVDVIVSPFTFPMHFPLYLTESMVNLEPQNLGDFELELPGRGKVVAPHLKLYFYDPPSHTPNEATGVSSLIKSAEYKVKVEDLPETDYKPVLLGRYGLRKYETVIGLNRQDLGDDFFRMNGESYATITVRVTDNVGHMYEKKYDFKVYFMPDPVHVETENLSAEIDSYNGLGLDSVGALSNRTFTPQTFKIRNEKTYPVWVKAEIQSEDVLDLAKQNGQLMNRYRADSYYEYNAINALALDYKTKHVKKGFYEYIVAKPKNQATGWIRKPLQLAKQAVNLGPVTLVDAFPELSVKSKFGPWIEEHRDTPNAVTYEDERTVNWDDGSRVRANFELKEGYFTYDCNCTEIHTYEKPYSYQGYLDGYYMAFEDQASGQVKVRKVNRFQTAEGYPRPKVDNQNATHALPTSLEITGANVGSDGWIRLEPGKEITAQRKVTLNQSLAAGDCTWDYTLKTCIVSANLKLGGSLKVTTKAVTLKDKVPKDGAAIAQIPMQAMVATLQR